ncbi:MAG: hypothetical protein PHF37_08355 [Phycisphaerae bacterium]|nr:hypothetical protein [Phycisphaerae bacterium]
MEVENQVNDVKKKKTSCILLPTLALIFSAMSFPMFGIPWDYAVGCGVAGLIRFFFCKEKTKEWLLLLFCVIGFLAPLLLGFMWMGLTGLFGIANIIICSIITILILCMSSRKYQLTSDIFAAVLIIVLSFLNITKILWFIVGTSVLTDDMGWRIFLFSHRIALASIFVVFIVYLIVQTVRNFHDYKSVVIRIGLIVAVAIGGSNFANKDNTYFLKGIIHTVRAKLDVDLLQKWLCQQQVPIRDPNSEEDGLIIIRPEDQPDFVRKLSNNTDLGVRYDWADKYFYTGKKGSILSVFCFYWGLVIGSPAMDISEELSKDAKLLTVSPGVYVWCTESH